MTAQDDEIAFGSTIRKGPRFAARWNVYPAHLDGDGLTDLFLYNPANDASWTELATGNSAASSRPNHAAAVRSVVPAAGSSCRPTTPPRGSRPETGGVTSQPGLEQWSAWGRGRSRAGLESK
jgi:hypothetical protein